MQAPEQFRRGYAGHAIATNQLHEIRYRFVDGRNEAFVYDARTRELLAYTSKPGKTEFRADLVEFEDDFLSGLDEIWREDRGIRSESDFWP